MLGSPNLHRGSAPLALKLKIDDLHAQLATLDRYGVPRLGSAITEGVRALVRGFKSALRGVLYCASVGCRGCEAALSPPSLLHFPSRPFAGRLEAPHPLAFLG